MDDLTTVVLQRVIIYSKMIFNTDISKSVLKYVCHPNLKKKHNCLSTFYLLSDVLTNLRT